MRKVISVEEAIARGYNFFVVAVLGIVGATLISEPFQEGEWLYKLDDLMLIGIAIVAVVWYLSNHHRYMRSWLPVCLAIAAFLVKCAALVIEHNDRADVGDDIGYFFLLLLFVLVALVAFIRTRPTPLPKSVEMATSSPAG